MVFKALNLGGNTSQPQFTTDPFRYLVDKLGYDEFGLLRNQAPFGNTNSPETKSFGQGNYYSNTRPLNTQNQITGSSQVQQESNVTPPIASTRPEPPPAFSQYIQSLSDDLGSSQHGESMQPLLQQLLAGAGGATGAGGTTSSDPSSYFSPFLASIENFGGGSQPIPTPLQQQQTAAPLQQPLANPYASAVESANAPEQPLANTYEDLFASASEYASQLPTAIQMPQRPGDSQPRPFSPMSTGAWGDVVGSFASQRPTTLQPQQQASYGQQPVTEKPVNQPPKGFTDSSEPYLMNDGKWYQTFLGLDGNQYVMNVPTPKGESDEDS